MARTHLPVESSFLACCRGNLVNSMAAMPSKGICFLSFQAIKEQLGHGRQLSNTELLLAGAAAGAITEVRALPPFLWCLDLPTAQEGIRVLWTLTEVLVVGSDSLFTMYHSPTHSTKQPALSTSAQPHSRNRLQGTDEGFPGFVHPRGHKQLP